MSRPLKFLDPSLAPKLPVRNQKAPKSTPKSKNLESQQTKILQNESGSVFMSTPKKLFETDHNPQNSPIRPKKSQNDPKKQTI